MEHGAIAARPSISREQAEAVRSITTTNDSVAVMVGHAGTGKTFTLDAAGEAWRNAGLRPTGVTLAGRAAAELGWVWHRVADDRLVPQGARRGEGADRSGRGAGRRSGNGWHRDLHRLLVATTGARAKLVLVGDHKQLAEIEAGGLFAALARSLAAAELEGLERRLQVPAHHDGAGAAQRRCRWLFCGSTALAGSPSATTRIASGRPSPNWFLEHNDGKHAVMLALRRSDVADLNHRFASPSPSEWPAR